MEVYEGIRRINEKVILYRLSNMTLFYGFSGVGKTHFTTYFPVIYLFKLLSSKGQLKDKHKFFIINTDNSFSLEKLKIIAEANNIQYSLVADHIVLLRVNTNREMKDNIIAIRKISNDGKTIPLLIAIDKINDPYYHDIMSYDDRKTFLAFVKDKYGEIESILNILKTLCYKYGTIVTMSAREKQQKQGKKIKYWWQNVYAGVELQYYPSVVAHLIAEGLNPVNKKIEIVKNRFGSEGIVISFRITKEGIEI